MAWGAAWQSLFIELFPCNCRFCNSPLLEISRLPVCAACLAAICAIDGPVCSVCGERLPGPCLPSAAEGAEGELRCLECLRLEPPFQRAVAYGSYESGLRELIHLLKYERVRPAALVLGRMLAEAAGKITPEFDTKALPLVVPVPLHDSKRRQRGFNQSELIARAMLRNMAGAPLSLNPSSLRRTRATESQTGFSRAQRRANVRGGFAVSRPKDVAGRDVLLVDDVFTTGTTVSECARVLQRAGAARVWVVTVARVLKFESPQAVPGGIELDRESTTAAAPLARAAQA